MTSLGSGPISFSTLKTRYVADGDHDASGDSNLQGESAESSIQLSWFRNASLHIGSTNSVVPTSGQISFNSVFKNKTFGEASGSGSGSGGGSGI